MFIVHTDSNIAEKLQLQAHREPSKRTQLTFHTRDAGHRMPFASLSSALIAALPAEKSAGTTVKELTTSTYYPEEVCVRGAFGVCTELTGLGCGFAAPTAAHQPCSQRAVQKHRREKPQRYGCCPLLFNAHL